MFFLKQVKILQDFTLDVEFKPVILSDYTYLIYWWVNWMLKKKFHMLMKTSCKEVSVDCQVLGWCWYGRLTSWDWFPGFVCTLRISWCIRRHAMRTDVRFQGRCHQSLGTCEDLTIEHVLILNAFSERTRCAPLGPWQGFGWCDAMLLPQYPSIFYWVWVRGQPVGGGRVKLCLMNMEGSRDHLVGPIGS